MDGSPNRRKEAEFSNFSGVVWTLLNFPCEVYSCCTWDLTVNLQVRDIQTWLRGTMLGKQQEHVRK